MRVRFILFFAIVALFYFGSTALLAQDGNTDPEFPTAFLTILGIFAPVAWQLITKYIKNEAAKYLIANGLSLVCGFVAVWLLKIPVKFEVVFILALMKLADTAYKLVWKPLLFNLTGLKGAATNYSAPIV